MTTAENPSIFEILPDEVSNPDDDNKALTRFECLFCASN